MTELTKYDAACVALEAAVTADEIMQVHVTARAIEAVGRVAQNFDLELKAITLRTKAEARLGDMIEEGERLGILAKRGGQSKAKIEDSAGNLHSKATLKELKISGKLAIRSKALSGIGQRAVDVMLARFEQTSRKRGKLALDVINSATAKRNADNRRNLARELSDASEALSPTGRKFPIVYADPAWSRKAGVGDRAYENHYDTMTWGDIIAMPVKERVLNDAWLFLWIPRAHLFALHPVEVDTPLGRTTIKLPLAYAVAQAWGFGDYSTCFVWTKTGEANPNDHGLGLIAWDQDEILCLFKRGQGLPKPDTDKKPGSNHREPVGEHSAKPAYYRQMINDMTGALPVLELFAREDAEHVLPENFYGWGNQSKNRANEAEAVSHETTPESESAHQLPPHDPETGEIIEDGLDIPSFLRREVA